MAMSSHQSAKPVSETWFTPPAIIEALGGAESFDLDPCSHVNRPWPTARRHLTIEDNSLILPWDGRVFLNPPYTTTLIARFMARLAAHGRGTALIFARTETDTFFRHVWEAASGLLFIRGRLFFCRADGVAAKANAGAPSVLIAYGDDDRDILAAAPIDGHFVPLRLPLAVIVPALDQTWAQALGDWFAGRNGPVPLGELYQAFARHPKASRNRHWRAKLRQSLQRGRFERVEQGVWRRVV